MNGIKNRIAQGISATSWHFKMYEAIREKEGRPLKGRDIDHYDYAHRVAGALLQHEITRWLLTMVIFVLTAWSWADRAKAASQIGAGVATVAAGLVVLHVYTYKKRLCTPPTEIRHWSFFRVWVYYLLDWRLEFKRVTNSYYFIIGRREVKERQERLQQAEREAQHEDNRRMTPGYISTSFVGGPAVTLTDHGEAVVPNRASYPAGQE